MRTDGVQMSFEAIGQIRRLLSKQIALISYQKSPVFTNQRQPMHKKLTKRSGLHLYGDIPMRYANVWILISFAFMS